MSIRHHNMKNILNRFVPALLLHSFVVGTCANKYPDAAPPPDSVNGIKLDKIYRSIEEAEYEIKWQDRVRAFQAVNRANNLRFTLLQDGVRAELRDQRGGKRELPAD